MEYEDVEGEQLAMLEVICGVGLTSVGRRGASFGFCLSLAGVVYYVIFTETPLVFSLRLIILLRITLVTYRRGSSCVQTLPRHLENFVFCFFLFGFLRTIGFVDC